MATRPVDRLTGRAESLYERLDAIDESLRRVELALDRQMAVPELVPGATRRTRIGPLIIDHDLRQAHHEGLTVRLTHREFLILAELAANVGRFLTVRHLMAQHRGEFRPDKSYVKVYIGRIRSKLQCLAGRGVFEIEAVRGLGYRLAVQELETPEMSVANIAAAS